MQLLTSVYCVFFSSMNNFIFHATSSSLLFDALREQPDGLYE
uniref:Macaca fascicularis brain cDNA, clone: QtrA-17165 n=1 Tax=Macaca fascicularis TaxID=9541 RepID=I7GJE0_MACFA|nr:unnamed protein product [Macaca fascicularis]